MLQSAMNLLNTSLAKPLPSTLHFISYPERRLQVLRKLDQLRFVVGVDEWQPLSLWEPGLVYLHQNGWSRKLIIIL